MRSACEDAVKNARRFRCNVWFDFNGDTVAVCPQSRPEQVYRHVCDRRHREAIAFRRSAAGAAQRRKAEVDSLKRQRQADRLMRRLVPIATTGDMDEMVQWVADFTEVADWVGVKVSTRAVLQILEASGYVLGFGVGKPPEYFDSRENMGRYIIGQAMEFLSRGSTPHPCLIRFAKDYTDLPSLESVAAEIDRLQRLERKAGM